MTYAAFDVIVVPFPFSDRLSEKRRPALVVSKPRLEIETGRVWVAMITSALHAADFGDCVIGDVAQAGLSKASMVRAGKITNIDLNRILRRVGGLSRSDQSAASEALRLCAAF